MEFGGCALSPGPHRGDGVFEVTRRGDGVTADLRRGDGRQRFFSHVMCRSIGVSRHGTNAR